MNRPTVLIASTGVTPQAVARAVRALAAPTPNPGPPARIVCVIAQGGDLGADLDEALARLTHEGCSEPGGAAPIIQALEGAGGVGRHVDACAASLRDLGRAGLEGRPMLRLTPAARRVRLGALADFRLPPIQFALYWLMAEWARERIAGAGLHGVGGGHCGWLAYDMLRLPQALGARNPVRRFMRLYDGLVGSSVKPDGLKDRITPAPANTRQQDDNVKYFQERLSALRADLARAVPDRLVLSRIGGHPLAPAKGRFGLAVEPSEIIIDG